MTQWLLKPVGNFPVSQHFGENPDDYGPNGHEGIDWATPEGTPVRFAAAGTVVTIQRNPDVHAYGIHLRIEHTVAGMKWITVYGHLSKIQTGIELGSAVQRGQISAWTGNTGNSTGPHLHFSVRKNGVIVDPALYTIGVEQVAPLEDEYVNIGTNILAQTVADRARMYGWVAESNQKLMVVCDETTVAENVKAASPKSLVSHRWVYAGDDSIDRYTPSDWCGTFLPQLPQNVWGYCLNEPGGDWKLVSRYLVAVMSIAAGYNKPVIMGNFSKGNPPVSVINAGLIDEFLLAFNDFPLHRIGVHLYWMTTPAADPDAVHYKHILARAKKIGAQVRFAATEAGRDVRGGSNDGWQTVMGPEEYALRLAEHANLVKADSVPLAVFCYGKGGNDRWVKFDIQDSPIVLNGITAYNHKQPEEEDEVVPGYRKLVCRPGVTKVNVRPGPGLQYAPIATVTTGDWAKPIGAPLSTPEGNTWQFVAIDKTETSHIHGYVSTNVIIV